MAQHDVFISYSAQDKRVADMVCAELESADIQCWIAPRDILPSAKYSQAIVKAIGQSRIMVLIFSSNANKSDNVIAEVDRAYNKRVLIVPFRIEDVPLSESLEYYLSTAQWLDAFRLDTSKHLQDLTQCIKRLLGPAGVLTATAKLKETSAKNPSPTFISKHRLWLFTSIALIAATLTFALWKLTIGTKDNITTKPSVSETPASPPPPADAKAITEASILAEPKILRAFWFDYPHEPEPGRRYWLQIDNNTWLEQYPSSQTAKFRIIGRLTVRGSSGSLLLGIQGDPSTTQVASDGSFEVFIPDKDSKGTDALFRHLIKGQWREWHTLGEMNVIK